MFFCALFQVVGDYQMDVMLPAISEIQRVKITGESDVSGTFALSLAIPNVGTKPHRCTRDSVFNEERQTNTQIEKQFFDCLIP